MKKLKRNLIICFVVVIAAIAVISIGRSFAEVLENDVRVAENSDLTYYLDVIYDGKDSNVVTSSDTATANVNSDYIYVEDKLPEGLIFQNFIDTADHTIGAVKRSDNSSCPGQVVGGYDGLKYDEATNTVSFRVKNLQAGCKLTVGIVTRTPSLNGKTRMDFYNTASARENTFSVNSNTVHVFMGKENATVYTVNYSYSGTVPDGAPSAPLEASYAEGTTVGVAAEPKVQGYDFTGWQTEGVTVTDGSFSMPASNVTFVGTFAKKPVYTVSYELSSEAAPEGYMVPRTKEYGPSDDVLVDSLTVGDIVNGYRFKGWTSTDVTIDNGTEGKDVGTFVMPEKNVVITGEFERVSYKVSYKFQGVNIPPAGDSLLPVEKTYYPGDEVTVANDPVAEGYKFLGWYSSKTFEMPEEDVVIYGEWMVEAGTFTPTIDKVIENRKDYYKKGDKVSFKITVNNTADYEIKDVLLQENLDGCAFIAGDGYEVLNDQYIRITSIPASGSAVVTAQYTVKDDVLKEYTNEVVLMGAIADGNNHLDTTNEYKATVKFNVSNIKLVVNKLDTKNNPLTGSEFTLYSDMSLTSEISKGLEFEGLVPNATYYLKETKAPTGYKILSNALKVSVGNTGEVSIQDYVVNNENGVGTVDVINEEINILPETGGLGNVIYIICGILIITCASIVFFLYTKKKGKVKK